MKRKTISSSSSSLNSSSQQIVTGTCSHLPDECWEYIFRFIIKEKDSRIKLNYLKSLSLVSKQFLSITNRLVFSYTVHEQTNFHGIFKRFTNINSLNLATLCIDSDKLLCEISCFPLKQLRTLGLANQPSIPTNGLQAFSQKIKTLTSLNCSHIHFLNISDLFLIAECFPLLEELDLSYPSDCKNYTSYVDGVEALSLALIKLRKVNLSRFPINNQSLFHLFNNCKHLEQVIMFGCIEITGLGLASVLRERPTLRSLSFSDIEVFATSDNIDSFVSLKGLTCLDLFYMNISNELLYSIARECLPLTSLDLCMCTNYSYAGIFCLLSKCQRIQHLSLQYADFLNDQHVVLLSLFLGDLVSINLNSCRKLTYLALFALVRNCPLLSEIKMQRIGSEIAGNSDSLGEFGVYPQLEALYLGKNTSWLSDEHIIMLASIFPNLQLLDLNSCDRISEGICHVLRRCCKIKHLNLAYCSRVNLLGMNFVVPKLEVLNLSFTNVDDETLYVISKNCSGLLKLLLDHCSGVTKKGVEYVLKNCRPLRKHGYIIPLSHTLQVGTISRR